MPNTSEHSRRSPRSLAPVAGLRPAGAICEIVNNDRTTARVPRSHPVLQEHGLVMITVEGLTRHRLRSDREEELLAGGHLSRGGNAVGTAFRPDEAQVECHGIL